jgi:hypothetical protein
LSRGELAVLLALTAWGCGPLVGLLIHAASSGDVFTGADGPFAADQLQYMAWIRLSGTHGLIADYFTLLPGSAVFLHPMFLLSGVLWRAGLGVGAALQVWKPVAIAVLFTGAVAYARALVKPPCRLPAVVLALFLVTPVAPVAGWLGSSATGWRGGLLAASGEMFGAGLLWGYLPTAIAIGLTPLLLLGCARIVDRAATPRLLAASAAAGALISWLHPWQGEVLLGLAAWRRLDRRCLRLVPAVAGLAAPLAYYAALAHYDWAWRVAEDQAGTDYLSLAGLAVALAPLVLVALPGLRRRACDSNARLLALWLPAALLVYVVSPSVHQHALEGIALPVAVLAARGVGRGRLPTAVATAGVALLTVPGTAYVAQQEVDAAGARSQPTFLRSGEAAALAALAADRSPGAVVTTPYLGAAVPALTGRRVQVGHPSWTPLYRRTAAAALALFDGSLDPVQARAAVAGARFAVGDCSSRADLAALLGPEEVTGTRRFGCATVYTLGQDTATARLR